MKLLLMLCLLLPAVVFSQVNWQTLQQHSTYVYAYKIDAATAEKYIKQDSINIDKYVQQQPAAAFVTGNVDESKLPVGHYVLISVRNNEVVANLVGISNLIVYPVNNQHRLQLLVRNKNGDFISAAKVWVNDKAAPYQADAQSYKVQQKFPDEAFVKVYAPGDTTYLQLSAADDLHESISHQRWNNFAHTHVMNTLAYVPRKIKNLLHKKYTYKSNYSGTQGTIVFNQPKYKTTDTVKLKAYLFTKHKKQYKKTANIYLKFYAKSRQHEQLLAYLQPSAPGAFVYSFPLSDTLEMDGHYTIVLKNKRGKTLLSNSFKIEDYLLDEVSKYALRADKETYYAGDSLHFFATANDANGLGLLDGTAKLVLTTERIESFYKNRIYVPDTLFALQKNLATEGETTFDFSTLSLPDANLTINATVYFKNSNNELQQESTTIYYKPGHEDFIAKQNGDSIAVEYHVNGKGTTQEGVMSVYGNLIDDTAKVKYPLHIKIDPLAKDYSFYLMDNKRKKDSTSLDVEGYYSLSFSRISQGDTLGFALQNSYKIPVTFTVFDGNKIVGSGKSSDAIILWKTKVANKHKILKVTWQYRWAGEEKSEDGTLALLYKLLDIKIKNKPVIFPGAQDTVLVEVKDYQGKAAANVNLTAVSYNSQFAKDIRVNEPPYLAKYHSRKTLLHNKFEIDDSYFADHYLLGKHTGWIQPFRLDTLAYYNMLMPGKAYVDYVMPLQDFNTEMSVHVVKNAVPQEVHLLYLNNQLAYYNGVTDKMADAYSVFAGYVKIGLRMYDEFIELDSVYIQPFYKHDLFIDLDKLPAKAFAKKENYWSATERNLLEKSIWMLDNNSRTNNGYVWQGDRVVKLKKDGSHTIGPFEKNDSLHFFARGDFDVHFRFEPGYEYNLSPKIERLEKMPLFIAQQQKTYLDKNKNTTWILGDTIVPPPAIVYPVKQAQPVLKINYYNSYSYGADKGNLQFTIAKDTIARYVILYSEDSARALYVLDNDPKEFKNINPGYYSLLVLNRNFETAEATHLPVKINETLCVDISALPFTKNNAVVKQLLYEQELQKAGLLKQKLIDTAAAKPLKPYGKGRANITGRITDKKGGSGIAGVSVFIVGSTTGTSTDSQGYYSIDNIKEGRCIIRIGAVGYADQEVIVDVVNDVVKVTNIQLLISDMHLSEVVVTAYGAQRQSKALSFSVTTIREQLTASFPDTINVLQGRVAGVNVSGHGIFAKLSIRGSTSIAGNNKPIYVIDGIIYDEMPVGITPNMIASMTIVKDDEAIDTYGGRAVGGAIVITTQTKQQRTVFRDYAYWQPQFFTDRNGQASFVATYPDNITGWQTYVLGMDKKGRMGKSVSFVKSYKPISAQLSMPQFLVEGDSAMILGKQFNYTNDAYTVASVFTINGNAQKSLQTTLQPNSSAIQNYVVTPATTDTIRTGFALQTTTGFKDGEDKNIPVFRQGIEEAAGHFYILQGDTTISYKAAGTTGNIELYAVNNTLEVLLQETEHLKEYPYYCMEQTASKLTGLLLQQKIKATLQQPFTDKKMVQYLLAKLQKAQQYKGGWSWWEGGTENIFITNYVVNALLPLRADAAVETAIRNGLLYLQNNLTLQRKDMLLQTLVTMGNAKHEIDYKSWLDKIAFDSLTQHQQWLYVKLKQQANLPHGKELGFLLTKAITGVLDDVHWGQETWQWHDNATATTVLAFEVLRNEENHAAQLQSMVQYFLAQRRSGWWANTVESATIANALLPYVLSVNKKFQQPARLQVSGDTAFSITNFPFKTTIHATATQNLQVSKQGGGLTYLTMYQNFWNKAPKPATDIFVINSYFEKSGKKLNAVTTGEKIKLIVTVNALKEADYVMIEIPIPAGCTYADKRQDNWRVHKEFIKNKLVMFTEHITKGEHKYEIELEPRYAGTYTVNPAKVSLMYFPIFYGRNEMKKVRIESGE